MQNEINIDEIQEEIRNDPFLFWDENDPEAEDDVEGMDDHPGSNFWKAMKQKRNT